MTSEQDEFIERLHHEHFPKLFYYAKSKISDPSQAEEVIQDTFLEAVKQIEKLMAHEKPAGWLIKTLQHKMQEFERDRRKELKRFLSLDTGLLVEPAAPEPPEPEEDGAEKVKGRVQSALSEEEWYLLKRITLEKATHMEVAKELGITVWAGQKRLERIRKKLQKEFPDRK